MAKFLKNVPITEEWRELELSDESSNDNEYLIVYKRNEDGNWKFYDLYNDEDSYDDTYILVPVSSVCHGVEYVRQGTEFVNVLRSTKDPKPFKRLSWIQLMEWVYRNKKLNTDVLSTCCTDGNFYRTRSRGIVEDKHCYGRIVGGHVLLYTSKNTNSDVGDEVFMLPICSCHNTSRVGYGKRTGEGFFMLTRCDVWALKLSRFLMKDMVQDCLNNQDTTN